MITHRSSYSQSRGHSSPLLRVKQSISRLRPAWRPPGIIDSSAAAARSTPSKHSDKKTQPLDHLARHSSRHGKDPNSDKPSSRAEISSLPELNGSMIAECAKTNYGNFRSHEAYERHMGKLGFSKREIFLIRRKREETGGGSSSQARREYKERHQADQADAQKHPSSIQKSSSRHFSGGMWSVFKYSLRKRTVSPQAPVVGTTPSEERIVTSNGDQAKDQELSQISNTLSPNEQNESIDSLVNDLHPTPSQESLHSNAKSRVTSWTNSSMTGSIALRSGPLELNRLSVIKEDGGPHQPSSSAGRHIGGVGLFQEPLPSMMGNGQTLLPIDSQRIYSALIERIKQEEAEIEETAAALEAVNMDRTANIPTSGTRGPTIRFVKSNPSFTGAVNAENQPQYQNPSLTEVPYHGSPRSEQDTHEMSEDGHHDQALNSLTTHVPFPVEQKCHRPSPFQQIFRHKRIQNIHSHLSQAERYLSPNPYSKPPSLGQMRLGNNSEDSIYSQATEGLPKDSHVSSGESSMSVVWSPNRLSKSKSMVEPMNTMRVVSQSTTSSLQNLYNPTEIQECNPWLSSGNSSIGSHAREQAEHDDFGLRLRHPNLRYDQSVAGTEPTTPTGTRAKVKMLFRCGTPSEKLIYSLSLDKNKQGNETNSRTGDGGHNKENWMLDHSGTPPLSTPGRLHLQTKIASLEGKLKESSGQLPFNARQSDVHASPTSNPRTLSVTFSDSGDSPAQNAKNRLVARLSRPFDMDVPRHNRPFDSMYLGKRTPGHADTLGHSRLSVAPRASKSYGGLRMPYEKTQADVLPAGASSSSTISRSASKIAGLFSGKRMVSSFLRNRRIERSLSADERGQYTGSPAFI